jgi:putative ABC transport system substrate-binding protein
LVPTLKTLGVMYDPEKTGALIKEAQVAAESSGLTLVASPATSRKAVPAALRHILGKIDSRRIK